MRIPQISRLDPRWWMLGAAIAVGLLAAWLAQRHLESLIAAIEARAARPMTAVVVAAEDLVAGSRIAVERVAVRDIPAEWVSSEAVLPQDFDYVQGAMLSRLVRRGEPILHGHIEQPRQQPFSAQLAAGRRAITIPVDEISSLSGMLEPGDFIDLYVSFEHRRRRVTVPLLQNVRVLATGRQHEAGDALADGHRRGYATVTLDASPEEAVKLVAARQQGSISAMLRHGLDGQAPAQPAGGDLASLLGLGESEPQAPRDIPVIFGDRGPAVIPGLDGATAVRADDGVPSAASRWGHDPDAGTTWPELVPGAGEQS